MIACKICNKKFVKPIAHVWQKHDMSAKEYKKTFGLDNKKGIITEEHKKKLQENLKNNKHIIPLLLQNGAKTRFKKGDKNLGRYERSEESKARILKHIRSLKGKGGRKKTIKKIVINCAECGKSKEIYPRYYQGGNNYCGISCRNIGNNKKRFNKLTK